MLDRHLQTAHVAALFHVHLQKKRARPERHPTTHAAQHDSFATSFLKVWQELLGGEDARLTRLLHLDAVGSRSARDPAHVDVGVDRHAFLFEIGGQLPTDVRLLGWNEPGQGLQNRDLRPQAREELGQLQSDGAPSDHDQ